MVDGALVNLRLRDAPSLRWGGEHLGLAYIAAAARSRGLDVKLIDADLCALDDASVFSLLESLGPAVIGITTYEDDASHTREAVEEIRQRLPESRVCLGGQYATLRGEALLRETLADYVCVGEGERAFSELVCFVLDGESKTRQQPPGVMSRMMPARCEPLGELDLNTLPLPARDTTKSAIDQGFAAQVSTSRGCYGGCRFCSIAAFYNRSKSPGWRARDATSVVAECRRVSEEFGVKEVVFVDDNFVGPAGIGRRRALTIARELVASGLNLKITFNCRAEDVTRELFEAFREAGLVRVFVGLESFEDHVLEKLGKGSSRATNLSALRVIEELGMCMKPSLILFTPWTTIAGVRDSVDQLESVAAMRGYDIANLFSHLWFLDGTVVGRGRATSRLRPCDMIDERAGSLFGSIYPWVGDLAQINARLGRAARADSASQGAYSTFESEVKTHFFAALRDAERTRCLGEFQAKWRERWGDVVARFRV